MTDAVALIEALGGGWNDSQLPKPSQVTQKSASKDVAIQQ
jgi:hypothetical protein